MYTYYKANACVLSLYFHAAGLKRMKQNLDDKIWHTHPDEHPGRTGHKTQTDPVTDPPGALGGSKSGTVAKLSSSLARLEPRSRDYDAQAL